METKPVIIDTDPGFDDALAIMMALASDELDIRGITITAGNASLADHCNNALSILEYFGRAIPVYAGAQKPILQAHSGATSIHGVTGMAGISLLDGPVQKIAEKSAVQFMEEELMHSEEKIGIIALAPLTNLAILLTCAPEVKNRIREIVLMGGAALGGNRTAVAEFNIWQDPEAAHIVFSSGVPIIMCGLDVTRKTALSLDDLDRIRSLGGPAGRLALEIIDQMEQTARPESDVVLHDVVAVARVLRPKLFKGYDHYVAIDLSGHHTRGCTVADLNNTMGRKANAEIVFEVDHRKFVDALVESIIKLNWKEGGPAHD